MNETEPKVDAPEASEREASLPPGEERANDSAAAEASGSTREAELEAELAETKERLLRALADLENLRRRTAREIEDAQKYAITGFARELLEVADNLNRALAAIPPRARDEIGFVKNLADGIEMTQKSLLACFDRHKIAKVEPTAGEKFDHNRHQAMFEVESEAHPPGTVADVMQSGYTIADRLLRPALVGVAKAPARKPGEATASPGAAEATDDKNGPGRRVDTTA